MNVSGRLGPAMARPRWARVGGTKAGALGWSWEDPFLQRPPLSPCLSTADLPQVLPWVLWVGGRGGAPAECPQCESGL